ncbi:hypothetical protein AMTR_s00476p00013000, partial [Amborella trichopoda]
MVSFYSLSRWKGVPLVPYVIGTLKRDLVPNPMGSLHKRKIWLRATDIPLHVWHNNTSRQIGETYGNFFAVHWKSSKFLPLDTIQLLIEVVDPLLIPSKSWLAIKATFFG